MIRPDELGERLAGPLASIRTPFTRAGDMDIHSLARMVDFDVAAGAAGLLITWGDSLFALLSDRDIGDLTRAVVECAAGRVPVIACTGRWATPQAVAFAEFCADVLARHRGGRSGRSGQRRRAPRPPLLRSHRGGPRGLRCCDAWTDGALQADRALAATAVLQPD